MSGRNVSRERNERGLQLFMQNLKGVVSLFLASQDITWTEELKDKEQTSWRLKNDIAHVPDTDDSLRESLHLLLGYIQSLYSYITSYDNTVSDDSDVSFSIQITEGRGDERPGRPSLDVTKDQIEFLRSI